MPDFIGKEIDPVVAAILGASISLMSSSVLLVLTEVLARSRERESRRLNNMYIDAMRASLQWIVLVEKWCFGSSRQYIDTRREELRHAYLAACAELQISSEYHDNYKKLLDLTNELYSLCLGGGVRSMDFDRQKIKSRECIEKMNSMIRSIKCQ